MLAEERLENSYVYKLYFVLATCPSLFFFFFPLSIAVLNCIWQIEIPLKIAN